MKQVRNFVDQRCASFCLYCFGATETRDHVPPKAFLDEPYPDNLPVVPSCTDCNVSASLDEQYVASVIEVAHLGSADPRNQRRPKVARWLIDSPLLTSRLLEQMSDRGVTFEEPRLKAVVGKIARGLWGFETGELTGDFPLVYRCEALPSMDDVSRQTFYSRGQHEVIPEVVSRLTTRIFESSSDDRLAEWFDVQSDRFSYSITALRRGGLVRFVIGGYLAVEVVLFDCRPRYSQRAPNLKS